MRKVGFKDGERIRVVEECVKKGGVAEVRARG